MPLASHPNPAAASKRDRLSLNRRDFLRAGVAVPAIGAAYFGYEVLRGSPVRAGIVGTGNEGCQAMIAQSPPDYLQYVAYHDIRPSQIARGRREFRKLYGASGGNAVRFHDTYDDMLADKNIEVIVVATPLWTHKDLTVRALQAGKHVFCEKLMAHNIRDAKKMVREADSAGKLLGIGHQRHYSTLYADAVKNIHDDALGDIHHIRAFWHRNNTIHDSWRPPIPAEDEAIADLVDRWGYKDLNELVRWRLYDRTGGGLMAELGSHQLDACSIFLGHAHPVAVSGMGGKHYFQDDREAGDHVYCIFEFAEEGSDPKEDRVGQVVTYSSINTNQLGGYGEVVMGTRGTMMVLNEAEVSLFTETDNKRGDREKARKVLENDSSHISPEGPKQPVKATVQMVKPGEATMYSAASIGASAAKVAAKTGGDVSRGYREELEHFAWCVRNPSPDHRPRCDGRRGLEDAVMALAANVAIRKGGRILFDERWYDPNSPEAPEDVLERG